MMARLGISSLLDLVSMAPCMVEDTDNGLFVELRVDLSWQTSTGWGWRHSNQVRGLVALAVPLHAIVNLPGIPVWPAPVSELVVASAS